MGQAWGPDLGESERGVGKDRGRHAVTGRPSGEMGPARMDKARTAARMDKAPMAGGWKENPDGGLVGGSCYQAGTCRPLLAPRAPASCPL